LLGIAGRRQAQARRPPNLGYGNRAGGDQIPPNSVLVFEMEAMSVFLE
jgi:FKBP-type peptidyl-prolyl cis-trans isomerase